MAKASLLGQLSPHLLSDYISGVPFRPFHVVLTGALFVIAMSNRCPVERRGQLCNGGEFGPFAFDASRQPCGNLLQQPAVPVRIVECGERTIARMFWRNSRDARPPDAILEGSARDAGMEHFTHVRAAFGQPIA